MSRGAGLSEVIISGVLRGRIWKPMSFNSFIIDLGTRTWSKVTILVSNMKWHRVADGEEDRSIVQGRPEDPVNYSNRNGVN